MRKQATLLSTLIFLFLGLSASAQRSMRIGYIDMDYILENVPEYQEAQNQLNNKADQWQIEIEKKQSKIEQLKTSLENERVLLTEELVAEREEEISFLENELFEYQQKRFGPRGDLMIQNRTLVEPLQDQIFNAVQDLAEARQYDFILDKTSDLVMLYANDRHDVSDQVLRTINRASKRKQVNSKEDRKELERSEARSLEEDREITERERAAQAEAEDREQLITDRRAERDSLRAAKKRAFEEKRQQILQDREQRRDSILAVREARRNGTDPNTASQAEQNEEETNNNSAETAQTGAERRRQLLEERQARRDSILSAREAASNNTNPNTATQTIQNEDKLNTNPVETAPTEAERRRQLLEERQARRDSVLSAREATGNTTNPNTATPTVQQGNATNTTPTAAQRSQDLTGQQTRRDSVVSARQTTRNNTNPNTTTPVTQEENVTNAAPTAAQRRQQLIEERQARRDSILQARQRIKDSIMQERQRKRDSIKNDTP